MRRGRNRQNLLRRGECYWVVFFDSLLFFVLTEDNVGVFDFLLDNINGVQISVDDTKLRVLARD